MLVAVDDDLATLKLCIEVLHVYRSLIVSLRSSAVMEVLQFVVIFSFFLAIFAHFLENAHVFCDTSNYLYVLIAYYIVHIGKAFQMCVLCEYVR